MGPPQGSVLGHLWFSFTRLKSKETKCQLYADDTLKWTKINEQMKRLVYHNSEFCLNVFFQLEEMRDFTMTNQKAIERVSDFKY